MKALHPDIKARVDQIQSEDPSAMVAVFTATGQYLYANAAHEKLLGYTSEELAKLTLPEIIHPDDRDHTQLAYMDAVLNGSSVLIGVRLVRKDGSLLKVHARAWAHTDPDTQDTMLVGYCRPE